MGSTWRTSHSRLASKVRKVPPKMEKALFEPLGNMMTSPEVINRQTNPAREQYDHCNYDLTNEGNVLLQNVQYAPNRANQTNKLNKHNCINFKWLIKSFSLK